LLLAPMQQVDGFAWHAMDVGLRCSAYAALYIGRRGHA